MSAPKAARNRRIVEAHRRDPSLSYAALGKRFGLTRARVYQILVAELGEVRKPPRALSLYPCRAPGCLTRFAHRRGYSGDLCPAHRGKPKDLTA